MANPNLILEEDVSSLGATSRVPLLMLSTILPETG